MPKWLLTFGDWQRFREGADAMPGGQAPATETAGRDDVTPASTESTETSTEPVAPKPEELSAKIAELEKDRARWQTKAQKLAEQVKGKSKDTFTATPAPAPPKPTTEFDGTTESLRAITREENEAALAAHHDRLERQAQAERATEDYYKFAKEQLGLSEEDAAEHLKLMTRLEKSPEQLAREGLSPLTTEERLETGKALAWYNARAEHESKIAKENYDKGYQAGIRKVGAQIPDGKIVPPKTPAAGTLTDFEKEVISVLP